MVRTSVSVSAIVTALALTALPFLVEAAWSGPTATAPGNNIAAPVNVGSVAQTKTGDFSANTITAFGNMMLSGFGTASPGTGRYLNFDHTHNGAYPGGSSGYGLRDNAGVIEYKNKTSPGWTAFSSVNQWIAGTGGAIYYNGGNVGIGATSPGAGLEISKSTASIRLRDSDVANAYVQINGFDGGGAGEDPVLDVSPIGDGTSAAYIRLFRSTNTSGAVSMQVLRGDNTTAVQSELRGNGNSYLNALTGNVGIGTVSPQGLLHLTVNNDQSNPIIRFERGAGGRVWGIHENSNYFNIRDITAGADRLTIDTSGNVSASAFVYMSDARLKENVTDLKRGLSEVLRLHPVTFTWKSGGMKEVGTEDLGFVAQEVEHVAPELVTTNSEGIKSVDYVRAVPILVKALQEQQSQIDALEKRLEALEK